MHLAPENIDPDALKILREAGFVWDSRLSGFKKSHRNGRDAATDDPVIDYEFLRDQKLIANSQLDGTGRRGQLQRLRIVLQSMG